jgi:hypothetical protein
MKQWGALETAVSLLKEMTLMLSDMRASDDPKNRQTATALQVELRPRFVAVTFLSSPFIIYHQPSSS